MPTLRQLFLVSVLLVQAVLTAAGSSLVLCIESGSSSQFELLSGACCNVEQATWDLAGQSRDAAISSPKGGVEPSEECAGCEDQRLIVAALERHARDVAAPELASGLWNALELFGLGSLHVGPQPLGMDPPDRPIPVGAQGLLERGLLAGVVLRC